MRTVFFDIDDKTDELRYLLINDRERAREFEEKFEVSWIFHENALEGAVLDIFDLKVALDHASTSDGILIPTYQRIRNHKNAIEKMKEVANESTRAPSLSFIKQLHQVLSHGMQGQAGGVYRKDIPIHRSYFHEIVDPSRISYLMNKMVKDFKSKEFKQLHPLQQAAEVHFLMMNVFPFDADTGKVARLLMNFFAIRGNYYPIIIPDIERQHYYEALRGNAATLRALIVRSTEQQLDQALRFVGE